jgi:hypothetical protein
VVCGTRHRTVSPYSSLISFQLISSTAVASSSSSLRPSQSASRVSSPASGTMTGLPFPRPFTRPTRYPLSVLWTPEDCKADPIVNVTEDNESRPSMRRSIRHEDGSVVSNSQWKEMRQAAVTVAHDCLGSLVVSAHLSGGKKRKKMFYKRNFPADWSRALRQLEAAAPLLSLCSGEWKADQTLGSVLPIPIVKPTARPSRSSTPSSLGPSRVGRSSSHVSSHAAPPSSVAPSSSIPPRSAHTSPRRVALKSAQHAKSLKPVPVVKATASKGKRRREPSPSSRAGKKTKSDEDAMSSVSSTFPFPFSQISWG